MEQSINNYAVALKEHLAAVKSETVAKDVVQKTRYALQIAKQALRDMETDSLEEIELKSLTKIIK